MINKEPQPLFLKAVRRGNAAFLLAECSGRIICWKISRVPSASCLRLCVSFTPLRALFVYSEIIVETRESYLYKCSSSWLRIRQKFIDTYTQVISSSTSRFLFDRPTHPTAFTRSRSLPCQHASPFPDIVYLLEHRPATPKPDLCSEIIVQQCEH